MSKITVNKIDIISNEVNSEDYYFFSYDNEKKKIKTKITFIKKGKTQTKWELFAATTEIECEDEIKRLNLT